MTSNSETPRHEPMRLPETPATDARACPALNKSPHDEVVSATFARQLERDLTLLTAERERLREALEWIDSGDYEGDAPARRRAIAAIRALAQQDTQQEERK